MGGDVRGPPQGRFAPVRPRRRLSPCTTRADSFAGVVSLATDATRERVERFLAECSAVLGSSLDYAHNLASLAELTVPFLGDICFIDISDDDGIRRMAAVHADPDKQALIDELGRRYPPDPQGPHPAVEALRSGATFFLAEITDDVVRSLTRDDNHYRIVCELGFRSFMCVPLIARGRTLGAVTLISCSPERRFGPDDVEVLSEVRDEPRSRSTTPASTTTSSGPAPRPSRPLSDCGSCKRSRRHSRARSRSKRSRR